MTAVDVAASTIATYRVTTDNPNAVSINMNMPTKVPPTSSVSEIPIIIPHWPSNDVRETCAPNIMSIKGMSAYSLPVMVVLAIPKRQGRD